MRIPLDYYRILGVPIQATETQLGQAHRDRVLQLPRREYSDSAIEARKQLIDEAYSVLSAPERRAEYDARFLDKIPLSESKSAGELSRSETEDSEPSKPTAPTPSLEIDDGQFVGALLILFELGEYEQVLKLGQPHLEQRKPLSENEQLVRADIVLTLALTCLELGREQWQLSQSENAALSGQVGQELLLREGLFPNIRGEIQADLYRLRPYRVLELLAASESDGLKRRKGLQILREMLDERGGIDGQGDDQSGLSIDDFLRFIQQLRNYLTVAEQQELFEREAQRPSAVATYLAVYALIARGFGDREPAAIWRARELLLRLGKRQDVYLEQAVCALLLGQPEEANSALELSREREPLAFIREHSQDSPDLLPGLCLYGERWLQSEVFPHFRDLAVQQASLKEYFADERVQEYLEQLEPFSLVEGVTAAPPKATAISPPGQENSPTVLEPPRGTNTTAARSYATTVANSDDSHKGNRSSSMTATVERPLAENLTYVDRPNLSTRTSTGTSVPERRPPSYSGSTALAPVRNTPIAERTPVRPSRTPRRGGISSKQKRLLLLGGTIAIASLLLFALLRTLFGNSAPSGLQEGQPQVELLKPPLEIPKPDTQITLPEGPLTEETAQQLVTTWLSIKADAIGKNYKIDRLKEILAEPALTTWQTTAENLKANNAYRELKHEVKLESLKLDETDSNKAIVEAAVNEVSNSYQNERSNPAASYNDNLRVRYDFVRENNQWLIKNMEVLK
ncbi:IMS domain-containing protein [Oscillatoria sp. FACHB-1406]|uniref:IMS domain-containing protein n=1 Tax=Oscillatoria sp. FACHB-1406 TaxID=2692846 RepID=UPI00168265BA|nr:DUF4101 domain-containing protein [Oscillatoria sp. FACHB-1406]